MLMCSLHHHMLHLRQQAYMFDLFWQLYLKHYILTELFTMYNPINTTLAA